MVNKKKTQADINTKYRSLSLDVIGTLTVMGNIWKCSEFWLLLGIKNQKYVDFNLILWPNLTATTQMSTCNSQIFLRYVCEFCASSVRS
jgi:hypothetical protein